MGLTKQTSICVLEVLPDNVDDTLAPTKRSPTTRPGFTRSESTLVAQEVDEKTVKSSLDALPDTEQFPDSNLAMDNDQAPLQTGKLASWKGALVLLITGGAMFMDNVFMTSTNISLSAIQEEFDVESSDLQWMVSAYTLSFGGFLLLSGVLSDRCVLHRLPPIFKICHLC
jgi:hypothetical protein